MADLTGIHMKRYFVVSVHESGDSTFKGSDLTTGIVTIETRGERSGYQFVYGPSSNSSFVKQELARLRLDAAVDYLMNVKIKVLLSDKGFIHDDSLKQIEAAQEEVTKAVAFVADVNEQVRHKENPNDYPRFRIEMTAHEAPGVHPVTTIADNLYIGEADRILQSLMHAKQPGRSYEIVQIGGMGTGTKKFRVMWRRGEDEDTEEREYVADLNYVAATEMAREKNAARTSDHLKWGWEYFVRRMDGK